MDALKPPMEVAPIAAIAANYRQFVEVCRQQGRDPRSVAYVTDGSYSAMRGQRYMRLWLIGEYYRHPWFSHRAIADLQRQDVIAWIEYFPG